MKLTVLCDNNTFIDQYYLGEPALSFLLEEGDERFLFDTGYSDVFLRNSEKCGIDLRKLTLLAFSHGHNDHTGGLPYLLEKTKDLRVLAHPDTFLPREMDGLAIGSPLSREEVGARCSLTLSREPVRLRRDLLWLGEIPATIPFEPRIPIGKILRDGKMQEDRILDDTALVYIKEDSLFVISGCSHSGICSILQYARKVTGIDRIAGVIGGFHLLKEDRRLIETAHWLKEQHIEALYPCHCVSLGAKIVLAGETTIREVGAGMSILL